METTKVEMKKPARARTRGWVVGLASVATVLLLGHVAWGMETTAPGEGRSREEAINNAKRTAIEQTVGALVKSQTQVTDGKLIWDRISSASTGYVRSYQVIREKKDPNTGFYTVEIAVVVDDPKLQNAIDDCINDPNCKRIFQEEFQRKVVVLYVPRTKFDLPYDSKGVQTVMGLIRDRLSHHQFRVFLHDQLIKIRGRTAEKIVDEETAIDLVRREKGDAAVVVGYDGSVQEAEDGYKLITCTLSLQAYDLNTAQFFASVQERGKTISRGGDYCIEEGLARIALKIGPHATDNLTKRIIERFRPSHVLVLKNASAVSRRAVEEILERVGWRYRLALYTGTYIEMEIFTEADSTTVQNTLDKEFVIAKLPLNPSSMAGSRIEFEGKARKGQ
jgi:hypothetical protein